MYRIYRWVSPRSSKYGVGWWLLAYPMGFVKKSGAEKWLAMRDIGNIHTVLHDSAVVNLVEERKGYMMK